MTFIACFFKLTFVLTCTDHGLKPLQITFTSLKLSKYFCKISFFSQSGNILFSKSSGLDSYPLLFNHNLMLELISFPEIAETVSIVKNK